MTISRDFLDFLTDQLRGLGHITSRRMFSGAGLYCDGVIFALLLGDTLYFKVDDGNRAAYEAEGLEPFTYEARGKTVRVGAYWRLPERLFDDPEEMQEWARAAVAAGQRAAAKRSRADVGRNSEAYCAVAPVNRCNTAIAYCAVAPVNRCNTAIAYCTLRLNQAPATSGRWRRAARAGAPNARASRTAPPRA